MTFVDHAIVDDAVVVAEMPCLEDSPVEAYLIDGTACFEVVRSPFVAFVAAFEYAVGKQRPETMEEVLDHMQVYMPDWAHILDAFVVVAEKTAVQAVVVVVAGHKQDLVGNHLAVCTDCTYRVAEP